MDQLHTLHSNLVDYLLFWFIGLIWLFKIAVSMQVCWMSMWSMSKKVYLVKHWLLGLLIRSSRTNAFLFLSQAEWLASFCTCRLKEKACAFSLWMSYGRNRLESIAAVPEMGDASVIYVRYLSPLPSACDSNTRYCSDRCMISCSDNLFPFLLCKWIPFIFV